MGAHSTPSPPPPPPSEGAPGPEGGEPPRSGFKLGPALTMICTVLIGTWLVLGPQLGSPREPGAGRFELIIGSQKVQVERRADPRSPGESQYRFRNWPERGKEWISGATFLHMIDGETMQLEYRSPILKLFNASGWLPMTWVAVGLLGQLVFSGRMILQWITSEQRGRSVVTPMFWWMSLLGSMMLFTYFVWRVDFVGVLGQSTGVVVYARNLRLIRKDERRTAQAAAGGGEPRAPARE